ncbi:MAG TPA: neutral zinc metallopeptidase [Longimicrobiales bacterium]|nr:neutral zinc metallopeptidase [Longimicrobiales bacterium]
MRWRDSRRSQNVEDRRGQRVGAPMKIGGGFGLVVILVVVLLGGNPLDLLSLLMGGGSSSVQPAPAPATAPGDTPDDEMGDFMSAVLGMTEDVWSQIFAEGGAQYRPPRLVLFSDMVQSACGFNSAATGPFYCPPDQRVYIDTGFFRELARMGGPGDFAQAYVLGHEVGHHVQNLLGTSEQVRRLQGNARDQAEANQLSVLLELQADCYAGVWAHHANAQQQVLEPGDVQEGMAAAAAIGDDRLMRNSGRAVSPESFTHGTSEQRQQWLSRGLQTGDVESCDTFGAAGM